jgi:hypothetical protein
MARIRRVVKFWASKVLSKDKNIQLGSINFGVGIETKVKKPK